MQTHTISRTGSAPVRFDGELLAESDGWRRGRDASRWHEIRIYGTSGGRFVAEIRGGTMWEGEEAVSTLEIADTAGALVAILRDYDPTAHVLGFPPGPAYAEKQQRVLDDLRVRYEAQIGEMLAEHADIFAEVID